MAGFTTTQLDTLERAIASGELVVQLDGKRVEYRSIADLVRARDLIRSELIANGLLSAPVNPRGSATVASYWPD